MHSEIIGMTESGKTCLAMIIAKRLKSMKKTVVVLDPMHNPRWECDFRTSDADELNDFLEENRSCYVFVDECGKLFNNGNDLTHDWMATRSRHYGHSFHFIAQRAMQIPRTMRDQCNRLFLFTSSASDGAILADEWNKPEIRECNILPQYHFLRCSKFDDSERLVIVNHTEIAFYDAGNGSNDSRNPSRSARNGTLGKRTRTKG